MKVSFEKSGIRNIEADAILFLCFEDKKLLDTELKSIEKSLRVKFSKTGLEDFQGKEKQTIMIHTASTRIILSGLGLKKNLNLEKIRVAAARGVRLCASPKIKRIATEVLSDPAPSAYSPEDIARAQTIGAVLALYAFDKYFTKKDRKEILTVKQLVFFSHDLSDSNYVKKIEKGVKTGAIIGNSTNYARDLGNEPSNILYPESLAELVRERSETRKYDVEIFDKKKLTQLGMGGVLEVARGSMREPRFIILKYNGADKDESPYIIVGKGVTFDSGGISIKPAAGMSSMKIDMGGAAAVIGVFDAISQLGIKLNVMGMIPAVENMPSGSSYKPGDVIRAYNGMTIEVDNTDAEGRLILVDALSYASEFKPKAVIDMATLTGAAVVALGNVTSIVMGNNEDLIHKLELAGNQTFDRVWQLPLWDEYDYMIDSEIADVRNQGVARQAGTIIAGMFLKRFIGQYPWAHIDIAATAIRDKRSDYNPKNATGAGVRLVSQFLINEADSNHNE